MAAPPPSSAGIGLYSQWLSSVLDPKVAGVRKLLDFMDSFESLPYKNESIYYEYARNWCQLASFLFEHKESQLFSEKVQMWFEVPERKGAVDVYWFEVVRSCDLLATATMHTVVQEMSLLPAAMPACYALHALTMSPARCMALLTTIKRAIGVCHYTLRVAAVNCIYMNSTCPVALASISRRYNTFRIIACWLYARHHICEASWEHALNGLASCESLSATLDTTPAAAPLIQSVRPLQAYVLVHRALAQAGQRGVAQAHLRKCLSQQSPLPKACKPLFDALEAAVATPSGGLQSAVPDDDSPLLFFKAESNNAFFELGTPPLLGQQPLVRLGTVARPA
jgi:hypothetical protein